MYNVQCGDRALDRGDMSAWEVRQTARAPAREYDTYRSEKDPSRLTISDRELNETVSSSKGEVEGKRRIVVVVTVEGEEEEEVRLRSVWVSCSTI